MSYTIEYLASVVKHDLKNISVPVLKQIKDAIETKLMVDPIGFGKPLRYSLKGCRRLRVGDYRIIYQLKQRHIIIIAIKHRCEIYEQ